jgi:diacylglycerol kinase (ATP)
VSSPSGNSQTIPDLILANPTAGGGLAQDALPRLKRFATKSGWRVELRSAGSSTEFSDTAREEALRGRQRIFALGGDGTFQVLLNALAGNPHISIGVLPAGGGNDLASALGLPLDPVKAAEAILQNGEVRALDAARVRTADGVERLYMGGGGVGLDAEAARYASGVYRKIRGRTRYLLSAIRALSGFHPVGVRITLQDSTRETIEGKALLAGVLNTPSYGAGLRLAPAANLEDGQLDLVILGDLSLLEILKVLPVLAVSGEIHTRHIRRFSIQQARIETDRPCLFHGDGEVIGQTPVEITVVRQAMKVWSAAKIPTGRGGLSPRNR